MLFLSRFTILQFKTDRNFGITTYPLAIPFLDRSGTDCPVLCKALIVISS